MKKEINQISSKRLQRIKLKLSIYDIEVVHVAGKEMYIADAISRACSKSEHCETIPDVNQVVHTVNMSITIIRKMQEDTNKDNVLLELKNMYKRGWPNSKTKVPEIIKFYFNQRNNIYVEEELVFLENRIIVPKTMRSIILSKLHDSHLGIVETKGRARMLFYWPNMNDEIENVIAKCVKNSVTKIVNNQ